MLQTGQPLAAEPADRIVVTVTFLRMDRPASLPAVEFPPGFVLGVETLNVDGYRALYNEIGAPWMWWLRRIVPDADLARHLANPNTAIHVLRHGTMAVGFFELDHGAGPDVNLSYFGLVPAMIGKGLGRKLLAASLQEALARNPRGVTVNTCTADHKRALPNYLAAGFKEVRKVREIWDIPRRLGLVIPDHLRPA